MLIDKCLEGLNEKQREAVGAPLQNMLVLAGAGSGKTRVLVHRIAYLIQAEGLSPFNILAVTFTNKAAKEMKNRIEAMVGMTSNNMWVGTFHGIAHRLLRQHWQQAELPQNFQIIDSDDQLRLIKRAMKTLNIDADKWPPKQAQWFVNKQKDQGLRAGDGDKYANDFDAVMNNIYLEYETLCQDNGLIDFAEMLLRTYLLWKNHPEVLEHYQKRFRFVLVDEFQDTNDLQFNWLKLLNTERNHTMVVGDDDQSIYSWRGAQVENMNQFVKLYANVTTIRLEQNYRSTSNILNASNHLIAHNDARMGKELWTAQGEGDKISVYSAFNDKDEANFIVDRIRAYHAHGGRLSECAILYRSNAQSRILEEALIFSSMPYRIYGGMRFYDRVEIKDSLAYMHLIDNQNNDAAFERIINTPTRGAGSKSLDAVRDYAREHGLSLWPSTLKMIEEDVMTPRAKTAFKMFVDLMQELMAAVSDMRLSDKIAHVIHNSGLRDHYGKERGEKGRARVENLDELVTAAKQFNAEEMVEDLPPLTAFLTYAALESGETQAAVQTDCVQLMTIHSAKGLEFPVVFIAGMEEELFPHQMSVREDNLDEERRLCYVGMTRAKEKLYLCHAETRFMYGKEKRHWRSQFIAEIPAQYLEDVRLRSQISIPMRQGATKWARDNQDLFKKNAEQSARSSSTSLIEDDHGLDYRIGQYVNHKKYGKGFVMKIIGQGAKAEIEVHFDEAGRKSFMAELVKLEKL